MGEGRRRGGVWFDWVDSGSNFDPDNIQRVVGLFVEWAKNKGGLGLFGLYLVTD